MLNIMPEIKYLPQIGTDMHGFIFNQSAKIRSKKMIKKTIHKAAQRKEKVSQRLRASLWFLRVILWNSFKIILARK